MAELSGRAIRSGKPAWGGKLAWSHLQRTPEHGQCWVELGVALADLGYPRAGRACLERARELGHEFNVLGELAQLWAMEPEGEPLESHLVQWKDDLESLNLEEQTAAVLCRETWLDPTIVEAYQALDWPGRSSLLE